MRRPGALVAGHTFVDEPQALGHRAALLASGQVQRLAFGIAALPKRRNAIDDIVNRHVVENGAGACRHHAQATGGNQTHGCIAHIPAAGSTALAVANDDRGAIDRPGNLGIVSQEALGSCLGALVGISEIALFVGRQRLAGANVPPGAPGGIGRADVMQAAKVAERRRHHRKGMNLQQAAHVDALGLFERQIEITSTRHNGKFR